ncbi:NACHT domain-containing protein [Pseudomonas putida]|uniref:NACHT domain-containing protein n=1 Tax=Pseudomonas putida TaxID=303 RepID=UPI003906B3B7
MLTSSLIPLKRTFDTVDMTERVTDDSDFSHWFKNRGQLGWDDLLKEPRVIILSEAGSGKTVEIRQAAQTLRLQGKQAFFLRLESLRAELSDAFEEGSDAEFQDWLSSGDEGWIFLDSVDEARLTDSKEFERAIRKMAGHLKGVKNNAHIFITGRPAAWRPQSDLALCERYLGTGTQPSATVSTVSQDGGNTVIADTAPPSLAFKIFTLADLHGDQVVDFVKGKGLIDYQPFLDAIARKDAYSLTTRPIDLSEVIAFWEANKRIGSTAELMENSITRRLAEIDPDRQDAMRLSPDELRHGARLVAAAVTLCRNALISSQSGEVRGVGLGVEAVLSDWKSDQIKTLLSLPIFEHAAYGTMRFHHRSVREYLTAEWIHILLKNNASVRQIEQLFFKTHYGVEIVVPAMRPVLSWLPTFDERFLKKILSLAPEALFEGGDPSRLSLEIRVALLRKTCERVAQPAHGTSAMEYSATQRFASVDIAPEVISLLSRYQDCDDVLWLLLLLIWHGEIKECAPLAKQLALTSTEQWTRIAAIRALTAISPPEDMSDVRQNFLSRPALQDRDCLAELLSGLPPSQASVEWLLEAVTRIEPEERFHVDTLSKELGNLSVSWPIALLSALSEGYHELLNRPPLADTVVSGLSENYGWLIKPAAHYVARMLAERSPAAWNPSSLSILRSAAREQALGDQDFRGSISTITAALQDWPEFNHTLFWHDVNETRRITEHEQTHPLVNFWQVGSRGHFWALTESNFIAFCDDVVRKELLNDKKVALSTAMYIWENEECPSDWTEKLTEASLSHSETELILRNRLNPPPESVKEHSLLQERIAAEHRESASRRKQREDEKLKYIRSCIDALRSPLYADNHTHAHVDLLNILLSTSASNRLSGDWNRLANHYGDDVAAAFREGAIKSWRLYQPTLYSEGAKRNSTPHQVIYGLMGLSAEIEDNTEFFNLLTDQEATTAARYACHEINGLPDWIPEIYRSHPSAVADILWGELECEINDSSPEIQHDVFVQRICANGAWLWDGIATRALRRLERRVKKPSHLKCLLTVVNGSSIDDKVVLEITARKGKSCRNAQLAPIWLAAWIGIDPEAGISAASRKLALLKTNAERTNYAVSMLTSLVGGRFNRTWTKERYRTPRFLTELFLLMQQNIREEEDNNRTNTGVYSPTLRDEAQDARNNLLHSIRDTPGKEAYLALLTIAEQHPVESQRPWIEMLAYNKATTDGDMSAWKPEQVCEFNKGQERAPSNRLELWELAVDRLLDLKHVLEESDDSIASILQPADQETTIRNYIGSWCRDRANNRYSITQEEEFADAKKADLRFHGKPFDGQVPVELKLADKWPGNELCERLENQLCGDYMRDARTTHGIFLLVYHGTRNRRTWTLPSNKQKIEFKDLGDALQDHWQSIANSYPHVTDIRVIAIDLTKRGKDARTASAEKAAQRVNGQSPD